MNISGTFIFYNPDFDQLGNFWGQRRSDPIPTLILCLTHLNTHRKKVTFSTPKPRHIPLIFQVRRVCRRDVRIQHLQQETGREDSVGNLGMWKPTCCSCCCYSSLSSSCCCCCCCCGCGRRKFAPMKIGSLAPIMGHLRP